MLPFYVPLLPGDADFKQYIKTEEACMAEPLGVSSVWGEYLGVVKVESLEKLQ